MESTPKGEKSQQDSSLFNMSSMFESTPKTETDDTPHMPKINCKKRKQCDIVRKKLDDPLSTPQASSTLNESLFRKFESIEIEESCDTPATKYFKTNDCERLVTPPSTPEPYKRLFETPIKTGSYQKCSSACSMATPLKEQHDILYPTLKPLEPARKILTPQKFREKFGLNQSTPDLPSKDKPSPWLNVILTNGLVMDSILQYLSGGDLFRLTMVSKGFKDAVNNSLQAKVRFESFKVTHKQNKENYKITPPSSPETHHDSMLQDGSLSPRSRKYHEFFETATNLAQNQSLIKCPKCQKPSVVEKSIAQCQNQLSCGYIYCQKCESHSYSPDTFYDKCQGLQLDSSENKRHLLGDVTNSTIDMSASAVLSNMSSGYYSGYDTSHTPLSVKRNLNMSSFGSGKISSVNKIKHPKPERALFESNRSLSFECSTPKRDDTKKPYTAVKPVVRNIRKKIEIVEPSSPPRVKTYAAGSKESKRNLKRLTR